MKRKAFFFVSGIATIVLATLPIKVVAGDYKNISELNNEQLSNQVTNVNQLRDVQPGNWAYEALRSLVDRYGCIVGYPNQTYRGNHALSRYEFAAGLNACLNQMERLVAASEAVTREDLETLERLMQEFEAELTVIGSRVDNLEERTAFLEDHQFSTTTKLKGEVIFSLAGAAGGDRDGSDGIEGDNSQIVFNDRVRLNLTTSFSGQDLLITGLQAYNFGGAIDGSGSIQNTLFPSESLLTSGSTKLGFEPQFPEFNPQDLSLSERGNNSIELYKLLYIFPSGLDKLTLFTGTSAEVSDAFPAIIPFSDEGQGAISRFATLNPVTRVSGGTSQTGLASAAGFIWGINDSIDFRALYGNVNAAIPEKDANNILGAGFFSGSMVAEAQLTLTPTDNFTLGLNYAYSYHEINILGTGLTRFSATPLNIPGQTVNADGTVNVDGILDTPVHVNSLGATFNWGFAPHVSFTGYAAYFFVDSADGPDASSDFFSWMTGLYFTDLLQEGNSAGLIFGQPTHRVSADGAAELTEPNVDRATPFHLEAFYNYKLGDHLSLTPGMFVLFNPESNANNDTSVVGVLRTTFSF